MYIFDVLPDMLIVFSIPNEDKVTEINISTSTVLKPYSSFLMKLLLKACICAYARTHIDIGLQYIVNTGSTSLLVSPSFGFSHIIN